MAFHFSVQKRPMVRLVGKSIQTNMEKVGVDCPGLWTSFGPRIGQELSDIMATGETYGVCQMVADDSSDMIYWAVFEPKEGVALPDDLETITLPAGEYVGTEVEDLAHLADGYNALYLNWPASQDKYQFKGLPEGMCFEKYGPQWRMSDPLEIWALVEKKAL